MNGERSRLLTPAPWRVVDVTDQTSDTVTLHASPVDGPLPSFRPAQVSMLGAFGVGEAAISISHRGVETHGYTIRRAGAITNALADCSDGDLITVRGPFGRPWPIDTVTTRSLVIVAGGLGLAPLRMLVETVTSEFDRFDEVVLLSGARTPDDHLFECDLDRWTEAGVRVITTVDAWETDHGWNGRVGLVPDLLDDRHVCVDWDDTTAMMCGPDLMMLATSRRLLDLGVSPSRLWLTLERNMQCGNALCGHCQLGPFIVCRDGPVVNHADIGRFIDVAEL